MTVRGAWIWDRLVEQIEGAVLIGYRRAYKHHDAPGEGTIVAAIQAEVETVLAEALVVEDAGA